MLWAYDQNFGQDKRSILLALQEKCANWLTFAQIRRFEPPIVQISLVLRVLVAERSRGTAVLPNGTKVSCATAVGQKPCLRDDMPRRLQCVMKKIVVLCQFDQFFQPLSRCESERASCVSAVCACHFVTQFPGLCRRFLRPLQVICRTQS
ncbi:hypothetical protein [Sulfitobacter mediterraneus]|uniref:hypothetical protein n=1 Tax=Sulfitobacter mediterraneus TaxID=83219 RepID=UPI0013C4BB87|nr:hypothetical protein [Sulfitobacter mediterraneus]